MSAPTAPAAPVAGPRVRGRAGARPQQHAWRIVAPWYRWELRDGSEPERALEADRPALHKYSGTDFVADFLSDPQRSVVFDPDVDVVQRAVSIPEDELMDGDRQKWIVDSRLEPDASRTRKLFLPAHQRFYLVAAGLHCDRAGLPRVDPTHVDEVGLVVRRRRAVVPKGLAGEAADLVHGIRVAQATERLKVGLDLARSRSRVLHPLRSRLRSRVVAPGPATVSAAREVELARRRLRTWAAAHEIEQRTEGWVPTGEGTLGAWVPVPDEPEELIERAYPMRLLRPDPHDPEHAALDGTIYYAPVPTSSDEVTDRGEARFTELDTYEIRVFARTLDGACPGRLVWSRESRPFRVASFYDPAGNAQRPIEIRLPDFRELAASDAMPSVRMTQPPGSSLQFSKHGEIPGAGKPGELEQICFFSIPLITIIAMFVLNLFLPIVLFVFQLWWMLKLRFCIPPSIDVAGEIELALDVEPGGLEAKAGIDIDVGLDAGQTDALTAALRKVFDPPTDPDLEPVPDDWKLGRRLLDSATPLFTNNALFQVALRNGYGRVQDAAPTYGGGLSRPRRVRPEEVRHP